MHPDRLAEGDAAQRAGAALKMAELNAAWEVLRDPVRRRELDRRRGGPQHDRAPGPAASAPWAGGPPPGVPILEPEPEGAPTVVPRRPARWRHPASIVVALATLVVVVLVMATLAGPEDPQNVETTGRFPAGSCVLLTSTPGVVEATCGTPGAVVVLGSEAFPRPCPAGSKAVVLLEEQRSLCVDR